MKHNGVRQLLEIQRIRNLSIQNDKDAKKFILYVMKKLTKDSSNIVKRYIDLKLFIGFLGRAGKLDLQTRAIDMKSKLIAKLLIGDKKSTLIDILIIRPLTIYEYITFVEKYPETIEFVEAALGMEYERIVNQLFQDSTNRLIPIEIAHYLADICIK
jgi:hypothetical protein